MAYVLGIIQIPALDRYMDYLEGLQQAEIDALTVKVNAQNKSDQQSNTGLEEAMKTKET